MMNFINYMLYTQYMYLCICNLRRNNSFIGIINNVGIIFTSFCKLIPYVSYIIICYYISKNITINYCMIQNINDILYPLVKGGILKIKFTNGCIAFYPYKLKYLGGWVHISVCVLIYICIIIPLLFVKVNIIACILYILAYILIIALYTNFWYKHVGFILDKWQNRKKNKGLIHFYIDLIRKYYKYLLLKFVQIWIICFIIVFINRNTVKLFFENDNIVSCLLIVTLALPISMYLINIFLKIFKKEKLILNDFYIFNKYVVERVNLYRILYLICITMLYKNYYIYWITTIGIIVFIVLIILMLYLINWIVKNKAWKSKGFNLTYDFNRVAGLGRALNKQKPVNVACEARPGKLINLVSQPDSFSTIISSIVGVGGIYQAACNEGIGNFYDGNKGPHWKKINFKSPGKYYVNGTVNILWKANKEMYIQSPEYKSEVIKHQKFIENSPILNMTYRQKNAIAWGYSPFSFFSNDTIYGSVGQVRQGNFLVINIIRKDWDACIFMPSYYLPEDTSKNSELKVEEALSFFETKYNILMPMEKKPVGFIVFTQAESINTRGLFRHWRPSLDYIEPHFVVKVPNIKEYYELDKFNVKRVKGYNNQKIIEELKLKTALSFNIDSLTRRILNEYRADKLYTTMLDCFLLKGKIYNQDKYFVHKEDKWYKKEKIKQQRDLNDVYLRIVDKGIEEEQELRLKYGENFENMPESEPENEDLESIPDPEPENPEEIESISGSENSEDLESISGSEPENSEDLESIPESEKSEGIESIPDPDSIGYKFYSLKKNMRDSRRYIGKYYANNNAPSSIQHDYILHLRRSYNRDYSIWNHELNYSFYLRMESTGYIEGFKDRAQQLGRWTENLYVPLSESRTDLWNTIYQKYKNGGIHSEKNIKNIYAICITRLSFEFLEFRTNSNIDLYVNEDSVKGTEAYSIIDIFNNNLICNLETVMGIQKIMLPKHDYNFFNNTDDDSIRKIMDFLYKSPDNDLVYKSYLRNEDSEYKPDSVSKRVSSEIQSVVKLSLLSQSNRIKEKEMLPIYPWGRVTQEEIDAYINKKQSIRKVSGLEGLESGDLLDQEILQATARANIEDEKIHQWNLKVGPFEKRPRNNHTPAPAARLTKVLKESRAISRKLIAERIASEKAKIAHEKKAEEVAAAWGLNYITDSVSSKIDNINQAQTASEVQAFNAFLGAEDASEINELVNIYAEPSAGINQEDFSYLTMAGVEDENLFGSSNQDTSGNFLSTAGTDTIEDEDIYSAN